MPSDIEQKLMELDDLEGLNYYFYDPSFARLLRRHLGDDAFDFFQSYFEATGELAGVKIAPLAEVLNDPRHYPQLENYDRHGNRIDEIELHPAGTRIRELAFSSGMIGLPYDDRIRSLGRKVPRMVRFAMGYLFAQAEVSSYYEIISSDACVTALERFADHETKRRLLPQLTSMDPGNIATGAIFLSEKGAGSDIGAIETQAIEENGQWRVSGHKWFAACANADVALVLARVGEPASSPGTGGLGLFLVEHRDITGEPVGWKINRLKTTSGMANLPIGEIVFENVPALPVGNAKKGFEQARELFNIGRIANSVAACSTARRAYFEAFTYARWRETFGKPLRDHPLIRASLLRPLLRLEGMMAMTFEAVRALDLYESAGAGPGDKKVYRLLASLAGYWGGLTAPKIVSEVSGVLGGSAAVTDWGLPGLVANASILGLWNGSLNMQALDVLHCCERHQAHTDLFAHLKRMLDSVEEPVLRGMKERLGAHLNRLSEATSQMLAQEEDRRQWMAATFCRSLSVAVQSVALLHQAQWEIRTLDDGRGALAAWHFLGNHVESSLIERLAGNDLDLLRDFEILAYHRPLHPSKLADLLPRD